MTLRRLVRDAFSAIITIGLVLVAGVANAADREATPTDQPRFALEFNPLPLAFGRISGNLEVLLAPHSALTISAAAQNDNNYVRGAFAELGYRYYSSRGIKGFFATASIIGGTYDYHSNGGAAPDWVGSYQLGAAADIGYQHQFDFGLLVGAGGGLQYQYSPKRQYELYDSDFTPIGELLINSGLRVRALLWAGYAF